MTVSRRLLVVSLACAGLVAACESAPPRPVFPDLRFTTEPPIRLTVGRIDIENDYQPPYRAPNVEHLFPVPPGTALENWARDRLVAAGGSGSLARFTIHTASVIETNLPQAKGIASAFTVEPAERYDMTLQATLDIIDAAGRTVRTANVTTTRSQGVLNTASPDDRDRIWYQMTKTAMADFDRQMTAEIKNTFTPYLVY